jgi:outer membrane protein OmpA-like peptidoglycan-associated protein
MKIFNRDLKHSSFLKKSFVLAMTLLILGGCANMQSPEGAIAARAKLTQLQNDPALASKAPVSIREADAAVKKAEIPNKDTAQSDHLVFIAARKVDIAWAQAKTRYLEDQREGLADRIDAERLNSRTREADNAKNDAANARNDADNAKDDADSARADSEELRRQMAELNAKETERGLVVTLGDMLFETGKSNLKGNAVNDLAKLSNFLKAYPDRSLLIEGHTDSVGSEDNNMSLSQRRADSVRLILVQQGVKSNRLSSYGKGESSPISDNESVAGRSLNRRVEVIITNPTTTN